MTELNEILAKAVGDSCPIGGSTPDFANSMDACIKWIVPAIGRWEVGNGFVAGMFYARIIHINDSFWGNANSPALAFCLAAIKYFEVSK
jgi:hypothetical protein